MLPRTVTLFSKPGCSLCVPVKYTLRKVQRAVPFTYHEVDISKPEHAAWFDKYKYDIPVVHFEAGGRTEVVMHKMSEAQALAALGEK